MTSVNDQLKRLYPGFNADELSVQPDEQIEADSSALTVRSTNPTKSMSPVERETRDGERDPVGTNSTNCTNSPGRDESECAVRSTNSTNSPAEERQDPAVRSTNSTNCHESPSDARTAKARWEDVLNEIARRWGSVRAIAAVSVPWFDDDDLMDAVGDALRSGDEDDARAAIKAWREAWLEHLDAFSAAPLGLGTLQARSEAATDVARADPKAFSISEATSTALTNAPDSKSGLGAGASSERCSPGTPESPKERARREAAEYRASRGRTNVVTNDTAETCSTDIAAAGTGSAGVK